ncbi:hypothetical protein ACFS5N_07645 [Mucilaginibacter ximonensis]|uniref:Uncharacterized protein n=1 Tax=Mucilaginibacter ximonensis TaxID=538021 RepID=A0ABW5YAI4_9SPHI
MNINILAKGIEQKQKCFLVAGLVASPVHLRLMKKTTVTNLSITAISTDGSTVEMSKIINSCASDDITFSELAFAKDSTHQAPMRRSVS